jgi:hypothetical protein
MIQGELAMGRAFRRAATLYSAGPSGPDHDAVIRIGSEAPGGGPILESGVERHGLLRVPPPRIMIEANVLLVGLRKLVASSC